MPKLTAPMAVLASAALLTTVGASSYAAGTLITGKQIKNGSITIKDLNKKTVTQLRGATGAAGTAGAAGAAGANGINGAQGAQGTAGVRGASAFEPIPSGTSVRGGWYLDADADVAGQDFGAAVPLTGSAAANLQFSVNVFFAPSTATENQFESPSCSGTAADPTAPAGLVCIYVTNSTNAVVKPFALQNTRNAFGIYVDAVAVGDVYAQGTWAYTAP